MIRKLVCFMLVCVMFSNVVAAEIDEDTQDLLNAVSHRNLVIGATGLSIMFMLIMFLLKDKVKTVICGAISSFMGMGAYRLSMDATNYQYGYIALAFVIISIVWTLYLLYGIIDDANKKDWGTDVDGHFGKMD